MTKKFNKLSLKHAREIEEFVKDLIKYDTIESYLKIAGVFDTLVILGYGYQGDSKLNAVEEGHGTIPMQNFVWWLRQLESEVDRECLTQSSLH